MNDVYKAILGQGGALILACLVLFKVMGSYETLIDSMIEDAKEDRALYQSSMAELTAHIETTNQTLLRIQGDIEVIKQSQKR
jgi:hypothetical protein